MICQNESEKIILLEVVKDLVVLTVLALRVIAQSVVLAGLMGGQRSNQACTENKPRQTEAT